MQRCCTPGIFRSVWDRLAAQLFGKMPVDINGEAQIPNVDIWKDGVFRLTDTDPYSFTLVSEDGETPHPGDIILYKGQYYVIGEVE